MGLLDDAERSLLEVASVFVGGWTIEAAAYVADLGQPAALERSEALARNSLIYVDGGSSARSRMLETIRAFVAEQLAARPDESQIRRRHADYYRAFAEEADPALRGADHGQCLDRLEAETGNLAAAVGWYLDHDRDLLPHLLRVLWPFWFLRDPMSEARTWLGLLLPTAGSLTPLARAELLWTAGLRALEVGDDTTALAASRQLAALQEAVDDPFMHAVSQLAIAWASPITNDFDGGLQTASAALEELRSLDEPLWTGLAAGTSARCKHRRAAATTPSATCKRFANWATPSTAPGWPPGPEHSWASWPFCRVGWTSPGSCSTKPSPGAWLRTAPAA